MKSLSIRISNILFGAVARQMLCLNAEVNDEDADLP
jgi:hypothetical protein